MYCLDSQIDLPIGTWSLWAKTGRGELSHLWESLPVHLCDTAEIARLIWREWLPIAVKRYICGITMLAPNEAEALIVWLAFVHDIGKATPSFQCKVVDRAELVREAGFALPASCENTAHSLMGQIIFQNWLMNRGWREGPASGLASIAGSHHGVGTTSEKQLEDIKAYSRIAPSKVMGGEAWSLAQEELLSCAFNLSGMVHLENALKDRGVDSYVQVQLTGLVIMADWIASNTDLLPLVPSVKTWAECKERARKGWNKLDLPKPLNPGKHLDDTDYLFHQRFAGISRDAALRPVQIEAVMRAKEMKEPGLLIIEAPMGYGKTEASLLCAEVFAQKFGEGGIAYLLPTQATSNAMFSRVKSWLDRLLEDQPVSTRQELRLLHGKAELNDDYASLPRWNSSWMGDEPDAHGFGDAVAAHQWFSGRKRGLLAPFVVGTVDQLLMAALRVKHAHLRHLGLAGKVVIVDEVHAYDVYMNVYLDRVLAFLGAYHVPVILLSATLPPSRRAALMRSYVGIDSGKSRRKVSLGEPPRGALGEPSYPLVTAKSCSRREVPAYSVFSSVKRQRCIYIDFMSDSDTALLNKLKELLVDGGCVCVLRNTVVRAQATFELLRHELAADVQLLHARFIAIDRASKDSALVSALGPGSQNRPKKLVVVATQVIEQSLDVDFDLLITDVAPVDLILQRIGRLHRHKRGQGELERPPLLRDARCIISGVSDWKAVPPTFAHGIDAVYQPSVLWKSIKAIKDNLDLQGCLRLPTDIAPLVESVYESRVVVPDEWKGAVANAELQMGMEMERRSNSAKAWLLSKPCRFNLNGWMRDKVNVSDESFGKAAVRDSGDSIEVVVVRCGASGYEVLPWVARKLGVQESLGNGLSAPNDDSARAAALCTVGLPPRLCTSWCSEQTIRALEQSGVFTGWQESRWLAGVLPLVVDDEGRARIALGEKEFVLRYSRTTGLSIIDERRK